MAISAHQCGHSVAIWSPFEEEVKRLRDTRENPLLGGVTVDSNIEITGDISCVSEADMCIVAVPSFAVGSTAQLVAEHAAPECIIVSISKGFDKERCERLSQIISRKLPNNRIVVLTGPSHAEEVARAIPTALVSASADRDAAIEVREALSTQTLRIYSCGDIIGAELGGAVKNIIALTAGISDGLGLGDNTKAALMTRGLREISLLGVAMGAQKETFMGLSGMGDLIVTCTSMHSRNRRAGILIGKGEPVAQAIAQIGTVEGYHATAIVHRLAEQYSVEMPICQSCYRICYENADPRKVTLELMTRPSRNEEEY